MTRNKAVTLIELLIAISLLTLILLAGSGIYLSGWNLFRNGQLIAQAQRNAVIPMMHITKQLETASSFTNIPGPPLQLRFTINSSGTATTGSYTFTNGSNNIGTISYTAPGGSAIAIGNNISYAGTPPATTFAINANNIIADITITATDNSGTNPYTVTSRVEARYGSTP